MSLSVPELERISERLDRAAKIGKQGRVVFNFETGILHIPKPAYLRPKGAREEDQRTIFEISAEQFVEENRGGSNDLQLFITLVQAYYGAVLRSTDHDLPLSDTNVTSIALPFLYRATRSFDELIWLLEAWLYDPTLDALVVLAHIPAFRCLLERNKFERLGDTLCVFHGDKSILCEEDAMSFFGTLPNKRKLGYTYGAKPDSHGFGIRMHHLLSKTPTTALKQSNPRYSANRYSTGENLRFYTVILINPEVISAAAQGSGRIEIHEVLIQDSSMNLKHALS